MANEFQVRARSLRDYVETVPFGQIGEEVPPQGVSAKDYPLTAEFREGNRYLRFGRPFRVYGGEVSPRILTDAENGMWVPDRLLVTTEIAAA